MSLVYTIAPPRPDHLPLVYSSFLRGLRDVLPEDLIPNSRFYAYYHRRMEERIRSASLLVAVSEEDADSQLGWVLGSPGRLDYVYVKRVFRRQGIATRLVSALFAGHPATQVVQLGAVGPATHVVVGLLAKHGIACTVCAGHADLLVALE